MCRTRCSQGRRLNAIMSSRLKELVVTDSIPLNEAAQAAQAAGKIKVRSIAGLLGAGD